MVARQRRGAAGHVGTVMEGWACGAVQCGSLGSNGRVLSRKIRLVG